MVTLYCSYLCYSALQSEPHSYQCNGLGKHFTAASGSTLAVGMVIAIVSVVYSALRAGSNNRTFMAAREEAVEEGLLQSGDEGTSAGLDGEPQGQSMGNSITILPLAALHCQLAYAVSVIAYDLCLHTMHVPYAAARHVLGVLITFVCAAHVECIDDLLS